jgi:AcrR family transcriptional regulator
MERKRPYKMRERAKTQDQTRQRIVDAAMHLHGEVGPRATSISAIAERAGVQRLTVYRHFPDQEAVFQACTAHWLSLNPLPDPAGWAAIENGRQRVAKALTAFYRYYRDTRDMWAASYRDVADVPALREPMRKVSAFLAEVGDDLVDGLRPKADRAQFAAATIHHALSFTTWDSLSELGLSDDRMVDLVLRWLDGAVLSDPTNR